MTQPPPPTELTIYLLCCENPVHRTRHYLGITRTERLQQRLREHAHRRGASLTAAMAARNTHLLLARTWRTTSWAEERRRKVLGHYSSHCPICRHGSPARALQRIPCPPMWAIRDLPEHVTLGKRLPNPIDTPQKKGSDRPKRPPPRR